MNVRQVVPRDAIPSVDDPPFGSEYFGNPDDDVIVVESIPAKAYPVSILDYHEIVNDVLEGESGDEDGSGTEEEVSIAVTWVA
ncbi:Protein of unknown function [Halobiforma haloterrestris]|uniref:Uncharacterized protein n=1 Tax=Natronobacterium haloterrestre TaxID=148448 RepID=A0A1I1M0D0_NATHA|nr:DUF3179 domain-containing (seleno)protein [Halobiforma haloterrestris]SFC76033.1 Protein of unknown function [Halobiforma haloterrestris]